MVFFLLAWVYDKLYLCKGFIATKSDILYLVLVQPRKTHPNITEKLLTGTEQNLTLLDANNKGADQPAHLHRLISTFVIQLLESIIWASALDFQQCGMCNQQSLRSACAYAQSDQSLCKSLVYSMTVKLLTEHHLEFLSFKGGFTVSYASTLVKMPHCWSSYIN